MSCIKANEPNQHRLKAFLSRHWPEVLLLLALDSVTLENLLITYESPLEIAAHADEVAAQMHLWGKSLSTQKIALVIESAGSTLGQPCIEAERRFLKALAEEMRHSRLQRKMAKQLLKTQVEADSGLNEMARV